ncbi:DNA primase [Mycobacteroides abscessus]|uniref:DNA primase n=1 Tax=Mycobacteroides abscessus TaxID=36809 RepID=UPI000E6941EA|nr:DNA primase [Mycobacteroides abscessus]RIT63999.1 DNA primase [Mycobacteroides abscessus]RIU49788.1 DNA primase [Mycobacteroides abscessus]
MSGDDLFENMERLGIGLKPERRPVPRTASTARDTAPYYRAALEKEMVEMASTGEGRRNDQLNISAFNLGQLVPHGLTEDEVIDSLTAAARSTAGTPMTDREIERTIRSGLESGKQQPRYAENTSYTPVAAGPVDVPPTEPPRIDVRDYEGDFWTSRTSLSTVYTAALAGMCSPWAVLACCAARALALVDPHIKLPAIIGSKGGSLNWFAMLAAESGGGKSTAMEIAEELIPHQVKTLNLGSGEGLIEAFGERNDDGTVKDPVAGHRSILFSVDEIDSYSAVAGRSGSTVMPILRSAFTGGSLGFAYRKGNRLPVLPAHSYRMTLVCAAQPGRTRAMFAAADGGTPQRFMWFPATDPRIAAVRPTFNGALYLPPAADWQYPATLRVPSECEGLIVTTRASQARGETAALNSHALFAREKFAYALAILDGRSAMDSEDWRLSGVAAAVSDAVRQWVLDQLAASEAEEARQKGRLQGVAKSAADIEKAVEDGALMARCIAKVSELLEKAGDDGYTAREIRHKLTKRLQPFTEQALVFLQHDNKAHVIAANGRADRWAWS